ncbi:dihydroorotase [Pullulanibacillus pueri]|uniref:Dihydroorotase n=1 Tax=Pullulanibacillus pueri TaxID=1437324 RepID=A0A8J2ZRT3_9BACL|nr:dihydroorotase [Pullulanibacillus pueri]MBM7680160.1 dihydroorotase [Pullulanibacillus pueri]GGH74642.1 dihydroorotase [Pullulanibacillus pueri]
MGLMIKNGTVYRKGVFQRSDVLIVDEEIVRIAETIDEGDHQVIDAKHQLVLPGFVDLHVHLREPGGEHKETIASGTQAAARGGFTTVAAMPNTSPIPDSVETLELVNARIKETAVVRVLPYASITQAQKGDGLTDFKALKESGAFAFSDDGVGVQSAAMMLEAMKQASRLGSSIVAHCEENTLINNGAVHDGEFAKQYGINGIPNVCEAVQIARDVLLAELADCHYHVCHVSTKESVRTIRDAKRAGIKVTAEVTPHHLLLTDLDIPGLDTHYKMNPPLRSKEDREALLEGLLDGTIDFIATDHAPHAAEEKAKSMAEAPFGIVGLETAFSLLYTQCVKTGLLTLEQLIDFLTVKPARAFDLPFGEIEVGRSADLTVVDLEAAASIDAGQFVSKGRNTPFNGWRCQGWPVLTIAQGKIAWEKGSVRV